MRFIAASLFFVIMINFSGVPELLSGLLGDDTSITALQDESDGKEKEDSKEKEEKEKENLKETILSQITFFCCVNSGPSLETRNGILRDSGYYPEDHYPPPELI